MYTHTTFAALQTELAGRLADPSRVFWVTEELQLTIRESLRTFGLLSGFWRERATLTLTPSRNFYDLTLDLSVPLLERTVTDWDVIRQIQYHLLEKATTQSSWPGTPMFTFADISNAVQRYRDQFLSDTGIIVSRFYWPVDSPFIGRQTLPQQLIDVRRVAWIGASPYNDYNLLWREDERAMTFFDPRWTVSPATPQAFSVMAPPPLQLQLAPPPEHSGTLDILAVTVGVPLTPAVGPTPLGIPNDLTPAIKWGALSYLLAIDGQASDPARSGYCQQRYQQYVALARMMPAVVHSEIDGLPIAADTLFDLDTGIPNWQNSSGEPIAIGLAGWNLLAVAPVPNGEASATLDVVRMTPVPVADTDYVQIGQEQLDAILEYAVHLALFKAAGAEFAATQPLAEEFLQQAVTYNQRLGAAARYVFRPRESSEREKSERPRRSDGATGIGAMPTPMPGAGGR